tara:strand:+ start:7177 stop:8382 length:1206 start_codon:yes stop_codon:yes gene_type:complete
MFFRVLSFLLLLSLSIEGNPWKVCCEEAVIAARTLAGARRVFLPHAQQKRFASRVPEKESVVIGNPCLDGVFQHAFSKPRVASSFLNAVLGFENGQRIRDVEYLKRDLPSSDPLAQVRYDFTVDLRCKTQDGRHFLVEMQNDFREDYHFKLLVEHSRVLADLDLYQTDEDIEERALVSPKDKTKFWKDVQGVYTVVVTNKKFSPKKMKTYYPEERIMEPQLVNKYEFRHTDQLDRHYGDVPNQLVLFMLANLEKNPEEVNDLVERWAYLLSEPVLRTGVKRIPVTKRIDYPERIIGDDEGIREFIRQLNYDDIPYDVKDKYIRRVIEANQAWAAIEGEAEERGIKLGLERGIEQGIQKGIQKGQEQAKAEFVKTLKENGISDEEIIKMLQLTPEQLKKLVS